MLLHQFEVPGLAQYSYIIASEKQAIVVDPQRDIEEYLKFAEEKDLHITHVLETHIHADFASGAFALAQKTNAELWLSAYDEGQEYQYEFDHHAFHDNEELNIGDLRIVAMHTPGHTPEHLSFLIFEKSRCGQPLALLSGDFLFVGSLGRPDLLGEEAKQSLAGELYESVHIKIAALPDGTSILPGHGAGSLCGAGMTERPWSTLGYERHCNIFMAQDSKKEFIEKILRSVPQFPKYYKRMKALNAKGAPSLTALTSGPKLTVTEFRECIAENDAVILDVRTPDSFGGAHIPGAFNIGTGPNLSLWSGWVLPYDKPIYLAGDAHTNMGEVRRSLIRVGHDDIRGTLKGGMDAWIAEGFEQAHLPQISVGELNERLPHNAFVLDVRSPKEWDAGHIVGAMHIPGGDLCQRLAEVPKKSQIHVICGSGYRSSIAASILSRSDFDEVVNVIGGMTAWNAQRLPTAKH